MATGTVILGVEGGNLSKFVTLPARYDTALNALLYSATQTESKVWSFPMPSNYASDPMLKLQFSMKSAIINNVDMEAEVMAVTAGDTQSLDTASFDSVNEISGGTTVPDSTDKFATISVPLTNNDSLAAGDNVHLRVNRDHDDADDDASGDLELRTVWLEYTTTA